MPLSKRQRPRSRPERKIIVHIATSADGYIARPDDDLEWLINRPAPKGFYGLPAFERTIDTKLLGRRTFEWSAKMGAPLGRKTQDFVFTRHPPPASPPPGVRFVTEPIGDFVSRLRQADGRNIWLMGGGGLIASFLDAGAIDEFIVSIVPVFIGAGIPLIAPRHRNTPLSLRSVTPFPDGVVQVHYELPRRGSAARTRSRASSARSRRR